MLEKEMPEHIKNRQSEINEFKFIQVLIRYQINFKITSHKIAQEQEQSPQHIQEEVNEVFHYHRRRTSSRKRISQNWSFLTISLSHIISL